MREAHKLKCYLELCYPRFGIGAYVAVAINVLRADAASFINPVLQAHEVVIGAGPSRERISSLLAQRGILVEVVVIKH